MKEGWTYKKLGEVCNLYQPKTISTKEMVADGKYDVFGANGIIGKYNQYNHERSEVLMTCRGATCGNINVSTPKSWINGNAMVIHIKDESILNMAYLVYALSHIDKSHIITGTAQPQITRQTLAPLGLSFPPLSEQQAIVSRLDAAFAKIDALKANAEKQLAEARSLFQKALTEAMTPKDGWEEKMLKELTSEIGDGLHGTPKYSDNGNFFFVNGNNLENGIIEIKGNTKRVNLKEYEKYRLNLNSSTLLLSINGTIGKTAFYNGEHIILGKSACYINVLPTLAKEYLRYILLSNVFMKYVKNNSRQATITNLGLKEIRNMPIPLPPLSEQQAIVSRLDALSDSVRRYEEIQQKTITECDALKQALLREIFEE